MENNHQKVALLILDGWGMSAAWNGNAIKLANPENFNYLWQTYPHWALKTYLNSTPADDRFIAQGLGYSIMSCGRFLPSSYSFVQQKISGDELNQNDAINNALNQCRENSSALHLCGLVSDNKKLSYYKHLFPILKLAKQHNLSDIYLHLILDDDSLNNQSQLSMISQIEKELEDINLAKIASICGRDWALDGDASFEKIIQSYRAVALGDGNKALDAKQIIRDALEKYLPCHKIPPTVIVENKYALGKMKDFDSLIMINYDDLSLRSLASIFIGQDRAIHRKEVYNVNVVAFSDYFYLQDKVGYQIAFKRNDLKPNLCRILAENSKTQLYLAQDFKSQHVSFYFQGAEQKLQNAPDINIISSADNSLGLHQLISTFANHLKNKTHDFILASVGSADYLAHRSKINQVSNSIKQIDSYLGNLESAALNAGYSLIICSDHGFVEQMANLPTNTKAISHTNNPVPLIIVNGQKSKTVFSNKLVNDSYLSDILSSSNTLADVAPTILNLFGLKPPAEMQGSLLE